MFVDQSLAKNKIIKSFTIFTYFSLIAFFQKHVFCENLNYKFIPAFGDSWEQSKFDKPVSLVSISINEKKSVKKNKDTHILIVEKTGKVRVYDLVENKLQKEVFLDVSDDINLRQEEGLLDLAFHPNYKINKKFYTFRTVKRTLNQKKIYRGTNRLSEFLIKSFNPLIAEKKSERILIDQLDQAGNHNGSDILFGGDGYLYVSLGDEGGGGDRFKNSQKLDNDFFSGIIRIDVDKKDGNLEPNTHEAIKKDKNGFSNYLIPKDNPWVNASLFNGKKINRNKVRTEFWAVGLRNVWRMFYDKNTNLLWAADVGQNKIEEINIIIKGGNYGWNLKEGSRVFSKNMLENNLEKLIDPIWEYGRDKGVSITGGIVYRGKKFKELTESYIFGDFVHGNVWSLKFIVNLDKQNPIKTNKVKKITRFNGITCFLEDPRDGGVLVTNYFRNVVAKLDKKVDD